MCSLQEHIERDIRAREAERQTAALPPQVGVTTKAWEHAEDCSCWHHPDYGYVISAPCAKEWGREALAAFRAQQEVVDSSQSAGKD